VIIRFVRIAGRADRIHVKRTDGSEASWTFPSYGAEVPHDMVHLVVEKFYGLRDGFWGRVDKGVDPVKINEQANRKGGKLAEKYAGFGDDLTELYLAEALAGLSWGIRELTPAERFAMLAKQENLPTHVTAESLAVVEHKLNELRGRWRALVPKGTMELSF
jgi:hypothetical protein